MRRPPSLEIISSFGVGYDNIDAKAAARLEITVTNTPGVLDDRGHRGHARSDDHDGAPAAAGGTISARRAMDGGGALSRSALR